MESLLQTFYRKNEFVKFDPFSPAITLVPSLFLLLEQYYFYRVPFNFISFWSQHVLNVYMYEYFVWHSTIASVSKLFILAILAEFDFIATISPVTIITKKAMTLIQFSDATTILTQIMCHDFYQFSSFIYSVCHMAHMLMLLTTLFTQLLCLNYTIFITIKS